MAPLEKKELNDFSEYILLIVSKVLGTKAQELYLDSPISQFGLDSLGITKIVSIINRAFKLKISPVSLYGHKTLKEAAGNLYRRYEKMIDLKEITHGSIETLCDMILVSDAEQTSISASDLISDQIETISQENKSESKHLPADSTDCLTITLFNHAQQKPNFVAYAFLDTKANKVDHITNADLHKHSLVIAKAIQNRAPNSAKIALIFDKTIDFIYALYGTFYSGSIAIPLTAPRDYENSHYIDHLIEIIKDSEPDVIFTTRDIFSQSNHILSKNKISHTLQFIIYDEIDRTSLEEISFTTFDHHSFALIQYSTGLSGSPKGVLYTHTDIIKHLKRIESSYQLGKESSSLSWLPVHHYMGMFYGILQPVFSGITAYLCADTNFRFHPQMWLNAISKYHISFTGGPEFAYELSADLTMNSKELDLSSWKVAYLGTQLLDSKVIERFVDKFQKYGFRRDTVYPSYGMAEAPLISTVNITNNVDQAEIICSGTNVDNIDIQIVDTQNDAECQEGQLGEIWFSDKGNERYFLQNENPQSIYNNKISSKPGMSYVRTGDVGYIKNDRLYVCGKLDDFAPFINQQYKAKEKHREAIAVIGMAGVFPQSDSCSEFWNNLETGKDLITEIPENRWNWQKIYGNPDNENQITDIKWGGFINDIEAFDASFFNISSKEAQLMDPMQRKLIQVVWQAVEDAGYRMSDFSGKKIAVIVGIGTFDYLQLILEENKFTHAYASTGIVHCMASNRISYLFDFKGPSESVDTACSSSLVALHRAVGLIRNSECEMAIVCGANILLSSSVYVALSNAGMLSKSGKCRTFDDTADGYVRGEGVAAIVLKKLNQAELDNDHIYGLIKGVAVNHGGHTSSLTAPNPFSQTEVIETSLKDAEIDASTISYVETHGTATALGDPIEISGLTAAFEASTHRSHIQKTPYCVLGSVKTNIGHLEAAAGIASVIKVLLSMRHKKIPAHLHFTTLNKNIDFDDTPFYLSGAKTTEWKSLKNEIGGLIPRRAGVSSFGFGGVNSHVTLEEYQNSDVENEPQLIKNVFVFSTKTEAALNRYVLAYCQHLKKHAETINLNNMAYTLQIGRESFEYRLAIVASHVNELLEKLENFNENQLNPSSVNLDNVYYARAQKHSSKFANEINLENIEKIAQQWVAGETIDWMKMYKGQSLSRISLPTYPFEKTYHWISKTSKNSSRINDTYDINWYAESITSDNKNDHVEYILFCDRQGISKKIEDSLQNKNIRVHKVYYEGNSENHDNIYTINPIDKSNYIDFFSKILDQANNKTFHVLNLWPLDFGNKIKENLDVLSHEYQFLCQTALYQVQALLSLKDKLKSQLWIISANVQPVQNNKINLSASPLWGMTRTLVLEQPGLFRSIIDIDLQENIEVENLLNEINSSSKESEVVYRQGVRYVPRMEPCEIEKNDGHHLKNDGAYLITGGLGALGLLVAEWMSSLKIKKIYLLSRRSVEENNQSSRIKETISRIQSNGTEVEVIQGDVTNLEQMKVIAKNHFKHHELKGVFHLAGSYQESLLENVEFEEFKQVVSSKVEGTWVLHEIFRDYQLDCMVMFSSGASIWGAATGGHYSAGNYFLDAYADYCKANHFPATSISWGGLWKFSGIIPKNKEEYFKSIGVKETTQEEGLQQLASIIDNQSHKKIVAPIEWPLFLEVMNAQREKSLFNKIKPKTIRIENSIVANTFANNVNNLSSKNEKYQLVVNELRQLLKNILAISDETELEEDTGFFNLGLDSLASIDFKNKINKTLSVNISTTTLFDCNTLRLLGNYLLTNFFETKNDFDVIEGKSAATEASDLNQFSKSDLLKLLELELGT